jgi:hypothetical protein
MYIPPIGATNGSVNAYPRQKKNYWTNSFLCGPRRIKSDSVHPTVVARQLLIKDIPAETGNFWHSFLFGWYRIKGK